MIRQQRQFMANMQAQQQQFLFQPAEHANNETDSRTI